MRVALVTASSYTQYANVAELPAVRTHIDMLCQRLAEPDAGYVVYSLPADRGLSEQIDAILASLAEPPEALLFYFAGYTVGSEGRGPGLLLDGERPGALALRRLRRVLTERASSSLVILDSVSAFNGHSNPTNAVSALNEVLKGGEDGLHVLAANRSEHSEAKTSWPFTNLLALVLDWHTNGAVLSPRGLFNAMRAEETLFNEVDAAELFEAPTDFHVLAPYAAPPPSLVPAAPAPEPIDDLEARADAFREAGDFSSALVHYTAALERVGEMGFVRHATLYSKIASALAASDRWSEAIAYYDAALEIDENLVGALRGAAELRSESGDIDGALELLRRWLKVEPDALAAAQLAARLLTKYERWKELAELYELIIERVSEPAVAVELTLELAKLYRESLEDEERASQALERAAKLAPADARLHLPQVELEEKRGNYPEALSHLRAALRTDPRSAHGHRTALRLFSLCDRKDGAWNAACVLEVLGNPNVDEATLASVHRRDGLLPIARGLSEDSWKERLFCPERDRDVDDLFATLGDSIIDVGLETARRKKRLMALDPATEYDPQKTTATVAKTLLWTARLLGIPVPKLHVVTFLRTAFGTAPVREPTLLMNKSLGSGLTLPELAFLWGRQLAFLRPEHLPIVWFPNVPELASLIVASLSLGGVAKLPFKKLEGDAKLFARSLKRHMQPEACQRLEVLVREFPLRDTKEKMLSWARAVELSAGRSGLLASGDVALAVRMTRRFPLGGLVEVEDQVGDLLGYAVSAEYERLRDALGVLIRG